MHYNSNRKYINWVQTGVSAIKRERDVCVLRLRFSYDLFLVIRVTCIKFSQLRKIFNFESNFLPSIIINATPFKIEFNDIIPPTLEHSREIKLTKWQVYRYISWLLSMLYFKPESCLHFSRRYEWLILRSYYSYFGRFLFRLVLDALIEETKFNLLII